MGKAKKIFNACSLIYSELDILVKKLSGEENKFVWGCVEFPVGNSGESSGLKDKFGSC